jgi:Calcineurin-like phosphoesterase
MTGGYESAAVARRFGEGKRCARSAFACSFCGRPIRTRAGSRRPGRFASFEAVQYLAKMRILLSLLCSLASLPAAALSLPAAPVPEELAWVQYAARGVEVRAVTSAAACPVALADGKELPLLQRSAPDARFPAQSCAALLPAGTASLEVGGRRLPLPKAAPKRIVLVGDTGCRLKGNHFQACNDPAAWPFAQVVRAPLELKPDLVIHLGDYLYREAPCPEGNDGCKGTASGDSLATWQSDFLRPAAPLLTGAPWLLLRGNHEECSRGGQGWSRLFDPEPFDERSGCNGPAPLLRADLGEVEVAALDSASIDHKRLEPALAAQVRAQLAALDGPGQKPLWMFLHRPPYGVVSLSKDGQMVGGNATLAAAFEGRPARLQYYFSGHQHTFQVLAFADQSPAQLVTGHGGTALDEPFEGSLEGVVVAGKKISASWRQSGQFGFSTLVREPQGWVLTNHDREGRATLRCELAGSVSCR